MIANTQKQQLTHHLFAVGYLAQTLLRLVTNDNFGNKQLIITTFSAGCLHDIGKLDPKFQQWVSKKKHDEIDLDEGQHVDETN